MTPNITQVTISEEASITVGSGYNFDKSRAFISLTAEVPEGESATAVAADLREQCKNHLMARAQQLKMNFQSTATEIAETQAASREDVPDVPRVAAQKPQTNWTEPPATPAPSGNVITTGQLEVGELKNKVPLKAKVTKVYPGGDRGPTHGKSILDGGVEVAHFDAPPQWSEGDTVEITNAFKVDEYNGKLQLNMGKFAKVNVTASAPPSTVDAWQ